MAVLKAAFFGGFSINIILFEKQITQLPLADFRARHIIKILKLQQGDSFKAGIIEGKKGLARIINIDNHSISLDFELTEEAENPYPVDIILSMTRPIHMKRTLKDLASLGCRKILLYQAALGEKSYSRAKLWQNDNYRVFLLEGAAQAGTTVLPRLEFHNNLSALLNSTDFYNNRFFFYVDKQGNPFPGSLPGESIIAIGPERGWTEKEAKLFKNADFKPIFLGPRILRAECAATLALGLCLHESGLWQKN